jgi:hypothetical protein
MDLVFLVRARRLLAERQPARLDHSVLVATLAAQQSVSAAARAQALANGRRDRSIEDDPLIELLLAGPKWKEAASVQRGCFDRTESRRRVDGP